MTTAKLGKNLSGLKRFILETAVNAGGKPCPPYGIGIGIGGQMDIAAKLSRKAISTRRWDDVNPDPELAALEAELKDAINGLGLGAAGTGGHRLPGPQDGAGPHPHRHRAGGDQLPLLGGPPGRYPHLRRRPR